MSQAHRTLSKRNHVKTRLQKNTNDKTLSNFTWFLGPVFRVWEDKVPDTPAARGKSIVQAVRTFLPERHLNPKGFFKTVNFESRKLTCSYGTSLCK